MRRLRHKVMLFWVFRLALATALQQPVDAVPPTEGTPQFPVSLARIQRALDHPSPLRITPPETPAHFHIEIRERLLYSPNLLGPVEELWSTTPGVVPRGGQNGLASRHRTGEQWSQPLVSMDLLSIGGALKQAIAAARRAHAERDAREEVQRAIGEFCATYDCQQ